jgi:uncharacterized iron-regulated membrane protein
MNIAMRKAWVQIHLWLGLSLGPLGVLIGLTGSVLVFDHAIDARLNPQRYSLSGDAVALPYSTYLEHAAQALEGRARPVNLRLPDAAGLPVVVLARSRGEGGALVRVYLDPRDGHVLEAGGDGGFIAWAHNFHESLALRQYSGRAIVGAVGIAMLISSLSGIYLWWPGRGRLRQGLGARRGFTLTRNLHYLFGFYGSLMLAILSFTGIHLAFPDAGRASVALFATLSAPARNMQAPEPSPANQAGVAGDSTPEAGGTPKAGGAREAERGNRPEGKRGEGHGDMVKAVPIDDAVKTAQALYPLAQVASLGLPSGPRGVYRVGLDMPGTGLNPPSGSLVVFIDPASGNVLRSIDPATSTGGDRYLATMRPLHAGSGVGPLLRVLFFVAGLLPALLAITGTLIWLRQRRARIVARPIAGRAAAP